MNRCKFFLKSLIMMWLGATTLIGNDFSPVNTQAPGQYPPSPEESLAMISVPEGFQVELFAAEPNVRQPIAMTFDCRGRLWVAESYTFDGSHWTDGKEDRILIFEDSDNDGKFNTRKVFKSGFNRLTSVELGFGGVWVLADTQLQFIPDQEQDDVPDEDAKILLDGWSRETHHNTVNGLTWGPDGWLYGRHGMKSPSLVGKPGTPESERVALDCSIWRFHPTQHQFQVVARGMVNPWGLDFDDHGQMFATNNVNGHLWHIMFGSIFERTAGKGFAPYAYERMSICSDHLHFAGRNWRDGWVKSRGGKGPHDELGGGHSHCGGMIYLGDNWPEQYRNTIFMCNTHGQRINNDIIKWSNRPEKTGFVGSHGKDFLKSNDPWFRGVTLLYGPDGSVFLSDWSDHGECHDRDGVHRTSGRIFKISYGKPKKLEPFDLSKLSNLELTQLQLHSNEWYVRQARKILQSRAASGKDLADAKDNLKSMLKEHKEVPQLLRLLWTLNVIGEVDFDAYEAFLLHPSPHIRLWVMRLLMESKPKTAEAVSALATINTKDSPEMVLLQIASSLHHLPSEARHLVAQNLVKRLNDQRFKDLTLLTWYGIEPLVAEDPVIAQDLLAKTSSPLLRKFIARRLTERK
jgi:putative membrane-bound dehydrogenase-like protein